MRYFSRNLCKKRVLWQICCGERSLKTLGTVDGVEGLNIDWEMLSVNQTPINYKRHNRRADRRGAVIVVFDLAYLSPGRHCRPLPNWIQPPPHRPRHSSLYGRLTKTNLSIKLCMVFWPLFTPQFVGSPGSVLLPLLGVSSTHSITEYIISTTEYRLVGVCLSVQQFRDMATFIHVLK